jgi:hypothetical protein
VVLVSVETGKSLYSYSLKDRTWRRLFDAGRDDISYPVVRGRQIFFSGTFSGIDNIYCYDVDRGETFQITSTRFGAFQPRLSSDGLTLFYSNYTSLGYEAVSLPMEDALWKPLEEATDHREQIDYDQTAEEKRIDALPNQEDSLVFDTRRYHKLLHLFNIHSWLPAYVDYLNPEFTLNPEQIPVNPGISLISQNRLSTAVSQLGYEYRDGFHQFHSGIQLKGMYPVMNLYFDYGGEPSVLRYAEGDSALSLPQAMGLKVQTSFSRRLTIISAGISCTTKQQNHTSREHIISTTAFMQPLTCARE